MEGGEKRVLKIDPKLFSLSGANTTRKNRGQPNPNKLKIKPPPKPKEKKDTLKKRTLLKMIRQHQEDKYKQIFEEKEKPHSSIDPSSSSSTTAFGAGLGVGVGTGASIATGFFTTPSAWEGVMLISALVSGVSATR
jgi:hypothetical protein